jgi:uncharacterized protein with PIN domain
MTQKPIKNKAVFRFYEELNDFFPAAERKKDRPYEFWGSPSVKDAIEAQAVPHTEVDLIIVDQKSVDFDYRLMDGDRVAVYPVFESMDISPLNHLRPEPLRKIRFAVDRNLADLARWLRLLGLDVHCDIRLNKSAFRTRAIQDKRVILTSDRQILKQKDVTHGYYIRSGKRSQRIREILKRFELEDQLKPFTRCMICNGRLTSVDKKSCEGQVPERVHKNFDRFKQCETCRKIYWEGSHYTRMLEKLDEILSDKENR